VAIAAFVVTAADDNWVVCLLTFHGSRGKTGGHNAYCGSDNEKRYEGAKDPFITHIECAKPYDHYRLNNEDFHCGCWMSKLRKVTHLGQMAHQCPVEEILTKGSLKLC
jgi:hypothetical protein